MQTTNLITRNFSEKNASSQWQESQKKTQALSEMEGGQADTEAGPWTSCWSKNTWAKMWHPSKGLILTLW